MRHNIGLLKRSKFDGIIFYICCFLQYKQRKLNEAWITWRKEFIKRKVVETMVKQDRRKLLSDVSVLSFLKNWIT